MKVNVSKLKFDEAAIRELIRKENQFLTKLWHTLPVRYSAVEQNDDEDMYLLPDKEDKTESQQRKVKFFKPGEKLKQTTRAKTLEELYARHNELKGVKKLRHKDKLLKKGLKHKITKQRRKEKRKIKKNLRGPDKPSTEFRAEVDRKIMPVKPVFNSEGKMVFSKFDFVGSEGERRPKGGQNPKMLLEKLAKQKEKLKKLESEGKPELAAQMKEKEVWKNALRKAGGEKVKDDPELLKKSVRKIKDRKQHSKKRWDSRLALAEKKKEDKQKKRTENLAKRKKEVKDKKLKKASKRGKIFLTS